MSQKRAFLHLFALLPALLVASGAFALTSYTDEAAFLAALGSPYSTEGFDGYDNGTPINDQIPGVVFFNEGDGYTDIATLTTEEAVSQPNILSGGTPIGFELPVSIRQVMVASLSPAVNAVGFYVVGMGAGSTPVSVRFQFANETSEEVLVYDSDEDAATAEFIGGISDLPIVGLVITSGTVTEGGYWDQMGIDDLILPSSSEDCCAPLCDGIPSTMAGILGIDGTGTDAGDYESGIASVVLEAGAVNATLTVAPFEPGASSVAFRVEPANPALDGHASVLVTDGDGKSCTLPITFDAVPAGTTEAEPICVAPGVLLSVTNPLSSPGGQAACSAPIATGDDPPFPPGYEPSPEDDPFPCRTMTIKSPISGPTTMVYKKDGTFEPRLRLLFSRYDGISFPPFADITESVDPIATVTPDPTRVKGGGTWSEVKVTCALLAEICNGLDDDGDGAIDEGLPVGLPPVDADGDGFPLCAEGGGAADCNDQIDTINPAATETCNGMDDNCDGAIDEGNPAGGVACSIPGLLGVCAEGETSCADGPMVCAQVNDPSEDVCDGRDNDCDGAVDENYRFGGYRPPVNADGTSIFNAGRVVPFKFQLTTCDGGPVRNAVAHIRVFPYASGIVGTEIADVESVGSANTDNLYRYDAAGNQYIYNLSTKPFARNRSYLVRTDLDDGTHHDVVISLR